MYLDQGGTIPGVQPSQVKVEQTQFLGISVCAPHLVPLFHLVAPKMAKFFTDWTPV
jgi:hypothetical protein